MAQTIEKFTEVDRRGDSKFDPWLDGRKWRLSVPEDADNLDSLRRNLYRRGKRIGKRVVISVHEKRGFLEVQAFGKGNRPASDPAAESAAARG